MKEKKEKKDKKDKKKNEKGKAKSVIDPKAKVEFRG